MAKLVVQCLATDLQLEEVTIRDIDFVRILHTKGDMQKILFRCTTQVLADRVAAERRRLAKKTSSDGVRFIEDELSAEEMVAKSQLFPIFKKAKVEAESRSDSKKPYWKRARLFVEGKEVKVEA